LSGLENECGISALSPGGLFRITTGVAYDKRKKQQNFQWVCRANVTEYGPVLYLAIKVGYPDHSRRVAVSRCCRILRRRTGVGGCVRRCVPANARKLMRKSMGIDLQRRTTRD